jgi:predicted nucleic acid-binding protein
LIVVVDASALTAFMLGHTSALDAAAVHPGPLHAPDLIELETLNALRRLARRGAIAEDRATEAVAALGATPLMRYPHSPLRARVWELRRELSAYDAAYLALAEALPDGTLLTADAGLATRARRSLGAEGVRLLE